MMLAQGSLLGIASVTLLHPSMMVVTQWFTTKKALATGVAKAGTALGNVWMAIIYDHHKMLVANNVSLCLQVKSFIQFYYRIYSAS
jgi:hypothetical protein